jgi:hypothetical protein
VSYLQVDDRFADHPKVAVLSDAAFRAHVSALCYCSSHLTDGVFPTTVAMRLARPKVRIELLASGVWMEAPGGYAVHDYLDWNPSRAEVLARRESKRQAGAKGGATPRHIGVEQGSGSEQEDFDRFWAEYPAKIAKKAARKAFKTALKAADAEQIIAGAARYREDPNRSATAHPSSWLNQERWNDDPLPAFGDRSEPDKALKLAALAEKVREVERGNIRGDQPGLPASGGVPRP